MNVVGLDPQPSGLVACLREGAAPVWPPVALGQATPAPRADIARLLADPGGASPGVDWTRLGERLAAFVGEPVAMLGMRQTVVAGEPGDAPAEFGTLRRIGAGEAALIAALGEGYRPSGGDEVVLIVFAGDLAVEAHGYRMQAAQVTASASAAPIERTGRVWWAAEVAGVLAARLPELDLPAASLALWAGADELAGRLTDAADDETPLAWTGPLAVAMAAAPSFSRQRCLAWPSVARLAEALPGALAALARQLDAGPKPAIVVAGVGAAWPFASMLARAAGRVTVLTSPELAVARGAAWWPQIGETLFAHAAAAPAPAAGRLAIPAETPSIPARPLELAAPPPAGDGDEADLALLERLSQLGGHP